MITREADYGMRVVLALSRNWMAEAGRNMSVSEIAGGMGIPYRFLRKMVRRMVVGGLVESRRGKKGGLRLARPPSRISVMDVVAAMAPESIDLSACARNPMVCTRSRGCAISNALGAVQREVAGRLRAATFDRLAACDRCDSLPPPRSKTPRKKDIANDTAKVAY